MQKKDMYFLGKVLRPKGNSGEVKVFLDVDHPGEYQNLDAVFIEKRRDLVPYFIDSIHIESSKANIKFQDVDTADEAATLSGLLLYLPLDTLPQRSGNKFYFHEIIGFEVIDATLGTLGIIQDVLELPNNPLFQVVHKGKEILIPVSDEFIRAVDRDHKKLNMDLPEGLVDIYL